MILVLECLLTVILTPFAVLSFMLLMEMTDHFLAGLGE